MPAIYITFILAIQRFFCLKNNQLTISNALLELIVKHIFNSVFALVTQCMDRFVWFDLMRQRDYKFS